MSSMIRTLVLGTALVLPGLAMAQTATPATPAASAEMKGAVTTHGKADAKAGHVKTDKAVKADAKVKAKSAETAAKKPDTAKPNATN